MSNRNVQVAARRTIRHDIALLVSTIAAPGPVAAMLLLGVACYVSGSTAQGLALGTLLATCATLPATLYMRSVLRQQYLWRSADRLAPLAIACASVLTAMVLVERLDAAHALQTALLTMFVVLGFTLVATPFHRLSVHMAAVTGASVLLQLSFGSVGIAALPIVAIVGWSRLELGEHTPVQVVAGAGVGAIGAIVAYGLVG